MSQYDVIVVGAGIAGLTASVYLARAGKSVLLCERSDHAGGLVNSFVKDGFLFDGGMRAMENSGIVLPMLRELGIPLEHRRSPVSIGIGNEFLRLEGTESLEEYGKMLEKLFPDETEGIRLIIAEIRKAMGYMDVLYGIDNPYFLDVKKDRKYFAQKVLPWLFRYTVNIRKAARLNEPVQTYLGRFTKNTALIDMITQHFFRETPTFFALSYFSLYLDYFYPRGGTGSLAGALTADLVSHGGILKTQTEITAIDPLRRTVATRMGEEFGYRNLIWAADAKRFYDLIDPEDLPKKKIRNRFLANRDRAEAALPGDSVHSLFLSLDIPPEDLGKTTGAHLFYTPTQTGLSPFPLSMIRTPEGRFTDSLPDLFGWLKSYLENTTYEISLPVLRYPDLAPAGKTGMIVSTLLDYGLVSHFAALGKYEEFKRFTEESVLSVLDRSLRPGLRDKVLDVISASPLTIERLTGNAGGAITGWSFSGPERPVSQGFENIAKAVYSPVPHVFQAGQWSFAPSGLPVSILTGKMAAVAAMKNPPR